MALSKGKKIALGIGAVGGITGIVLVVASKAKAGATPTPTPPLPGLANLYGKVTNASSGSPVAGALITLDSITVSTDSNGNYTINDIAPGSYTFAVQKTGYNTFTQDVNIAEGSHQGDIQLVPVAAPPPTAKFQLSNMILTSEQNPVATAFWIIGMTAKITNPGSVAVSHKLKCGWTYSEARGYSHTDVSGYISERYWANGLQELEITLNPGQSVNIESPAWVDAIGGSNPPNGGYHAGVPLVYWIGVWDEENDILGYSSIGTYP